MAPQRQLADAQNRLNTHRAASADAADNEGGWGDAGDSVLDLLREQVFPVIPIVYLYTTPHMTSAKLKSVLTLLLPLP